VRFGVNYTPRVNWWHAWLDFQPAEIARDFEQIAALEFDHVRIFPVWSYFQPDRRHVRLQAITDLVRMVELAGAAGLDVQIDGLQGHLSSFDFYPPWTQTWHRRNVFTDPDVIEAQALLLRTIGAAVRGLPNVLGMTVGNEMNNLVEHNPVSIDQVDDWVDAMLVALDESLIAGSASQAPLRTVPIRCHSAYDAAWYTDGHPFTPQTSARKGTLTTVHPWVFSNDCARRYGALSTATTHLAEYAVELAKAYADDPARPVWVQEVGAPEGHIPPENSPEFAEQIIGNAVTCRDVFGITWWCSHDVDREFADFPALEYSLGLIDSNGVTKPLGWKISEVVRTLRNAPPTPVKRDTALVFTGGGTDSRSASGPGGAYFESWMRHAEAGERLAIVLADRASDTDYLRSRGIATLIE
jgi:hypothetical protein